MCNMPGFKVFINPKSIIFTSFCSQNLSCWALSPTSILVAVFAKTCPEVQWDVFQACLIKVVTRNLMCTPASFPLLLTLSHVCNCFHCSVICLAASTCCLVFRNNGNLKRHILYYLIKIGSFLTSSDASLQNKWQVVWFFPARSP